MSKKYIAVASSVVLTLATMIGIPLKQYAEKIHYKVCIDEAYVPKKWTPHMSKVYAVAYMKAYYPEWNKYQHHMLMLLWGKESGWSYTADNPHSTAYGIAQVLGTKHGTPAPQQVARGLDYIVHRYGMPSVAWAHWRNHGWY